MDALPFIKEILSQPALRLFLSDDIQFNDGPFHEDYKRSLSREIVSVLMKIRFDLVGDTEDKKIDLIKCMRLEARQIGRASGEHIPGLRTHNFVSYWKKKLNHNINDMISCNYLMQTEAEGELEHKDIDALISSLHNIKRIEHLLPHKADSSNCFTNEEKNRAFLLITAFPALRELKEPYKILVFLLELTRELDNLPQLIGKACEGEPLALVLVGGLLSFKPMDYKTWNKVKDDLLAVEIKEFDNVATNNHLLHVINYCYKDLPDIIKSCFLYLACYPMDYEIPARSLTEIWIAEGFVTPEEGQTTEDTANNYLEQLVQRSLVCVSKRSVLGTIKCCRVGRSIHEYAINQSYEERFLAANPDQKAIKSTSRVAIHDNKKQNPNLVLNRRIVSFSCFDVDRNDVKMSDMLRVLELRNSAIPEAPFTSMCRLRYLGLRRSKISELPTTMWLIKFLQTLDVRDTSIKTLPESLWTISTLRHVYVNPKPQIQGPPSTATTSNLQILKTVTVHKSWLGNSPMFLINLRKLALSNRNNLYWESISIMLSHMVNLLSMTITGDILPSEFVDTRAFPNLETVKAIKLDGKWICRNLIIDNVKFPSNLTKLTLTKSGLKEDPMPRLEKIEALKYLSLQDGAYTGKKMVCSSNGFPQLQFLQLSKLENLKTWEMKPMAMLQLTTLHVVNCCKLENLPDLKNVTALVNYCKLENHKRNAAFGALI